jgi:hypothetical protein
MSWAAETVTFGRREPSWCLCCGQDIEHSATWCETCHPARGEVTGEWERWQIECQEDAERETERAEDRLLVGLAYAMARFTGMSRANRFWMEGMLP